MQYPRYLLGPLQASISRGKARLVLGARQTGKSTLFRMVRQPDDLLFDLQDRSERMRFARDPEAFRRELEAVRRRHVRVLVDEVQRVPELFDEIQLLIDRHPGRFTFTLTGSSARRLRRGPTNLLPGRIHRFQLSPICSWEIGGSGRGTILPRPRGAPRGRFPARRLESLLIFGSLPAAFVEPAAFERTLGGYAEAYVEEEVLREMAARNLGAYARFLELAALDSGRATNLTKISQESGIALSTLRGYYAVLEDTLLGFTLQPFARSPRARLMKTPRFFFFDVGVRNALARLPLEEAMLAQEGGALLEHWVACELQARVSYLGNRYRLSFWRTTDGAEVDLIVETPGEVIPIEVKFTRNPRPADARGIEHFIARHPGLSRRGYVVCRAARRQQLSEHATALPWQEL